LNREVVPFTTREAWLEQRSQDITSTETAALFGQSPYCTPFELFHNKLNRTIIEIDDNERKKWGRELQDVIARVVCEERGWTFRRMEEYIRIPELRLGASFDYEITLPDGRKGLLEVKNVDGFIFRQQWPKVEGGHEAPVHIEAQLQTQLLVAGDEYEFGFIAALVGGNRLVLIERVPVGTIREAILERAAKLWQDIADQNAPSPDWIEDAEFVMKLFGKVEPGKVYDATTDGVLKELALALNEQCQIASEAERQKDGLKAQIVAVLQEHERANGDGYTITATVTKTKKRDVRVYMKENPQ